ncbi:LPS-assembly protein LptD [Suttonella ornithocola]|uniref:LPS-assembly protein LptD n=1 Tax=Suttonella ornithocola TaxID=279832 RepID=UPI001FE76C6C|nr:LPS-assembly protein LptD [Suttonella ornithocola]
MGLEHDYQFNPSWKTEIRYQQVSDINYLEDIDNGLTLYDEWYLDRYAKILGNGNWGNLMVQLQSYERVSPEVDEANTPYDRLPQIVYHKDWQTGQFHYGITTEAVRFYKSSEGNANRFSANAEVNYRLSKSYGYLEPKLTVNARRYDFHPDNHAFREGQKTLVIPSLSLDGSLIFERGINIEGSSFTQTLEPRLFYLYTPYKAQSDIPLFDTADLSKSWHWLFARNRFSGGDRIGDANQLTTAVTTRFYRNSDGQEKLRLSLGQIQYFADRKLQLYGNAVTNTSKSVIVTEGNYQIDRHWSLYGLSFWDPNKHRNDRNVLDLRYHLDTNRYLQLGHYYNRDDYNQLSLGIGWRLNPNWRVFARQDYSLRERQGFNTMAAIEYNDCCWAWRLAGRHYRNKPEDQTKHNAVYLEFIFKGLGNMGSSTGSLLKNQLNQFTPLPQERTL